jgi:hypothetical protein
VTAPQQPGVDGLRQVRLVRFPLDVYVRTQEHVDDLVRELTLIANSRAVADGTSDLPERLLTLVEELTHQYAGVSNHADRLRDEAIDRGDRSIDIVYTVPAAAADACRHLGVVFDEADEYCRAGEHLLTLATPAEALAFRRWYLTEFIAQIEQGAEPTPWCDGVGADHDS